MKNGTLLFPGCYSVSGSENVPCLIYITFSNKIFIYYNITLGEVGCSDLFATMKEKEEVRDLLNYFNVDGENVSVQLISALSFTLQPC